ncbi:hypothetical protein D3C80_1848460 [compost metagenome]
MGRHMRSALCGFLTNGLQQLLIKLGQSEGAGVVAVFQRCFDKMNALRQHLPDLNSGFLHTSNPYRRLSAVSSGSREHFT